MYHVPGMVRLLPRLARINQSPVCDVKRQRPRRPKSVHRPALPPPPLNSHFSLLLHPQNPIATPDLYVRHKSLPPRVFVPKIPHHRAGEYDRPRQMSAEERRWWSSPYRVSNSLLAFFFEASIQSACSQLLPATVLSLGVSCHQVRSQETFAIFFLLTLGIAFLLRLAALRMHLSEPTANKPVSCMIAPDGLQHPQFTARRSNRSVHVVCSRQAISFCIANNRVGSLPAYARIPPNLTEQISHLLRVRILQELDLLLAQLRARPKADILANPPIRRLSHLEWTKVQENRQIPWQDAIAVINVPPISNPTEPSMSPFPLPFDPEMAANASQPVATFYPVSRISALPTNFQYRDVLPSARVPLYNVLGLFPHIAQRTAFHQFLNQTQSRLETACSRKADSKEASKEADNEEASSSPSDAYILTSNSQTIKLVDMPALAIAMWRVYLYERSIVRE